MKAHILFPVTINSFVPLLTVCGLAALSNSGALAAAAYDMTAPVGPHHKIIDTMVTFRDPDGQERPHHTHYTQLEMGSSYLENGQWLESESKVEPHPRGAAALKGYFTVVFAKNLNQMGAVQITLPGGRPLKTQPLGLYYVDHETGNWVQLASLKDCAGEIIPPNRVIYRNAFEPVSADVEFTYTKGGLESHVVVRENLAPPASFGLNNASTVLQVATEFAGAEPSVAETTSQAPATGTSGQKHNFTDHLLDFGEFLMVQGTAFPMVHDRADKGNAVAVIKSWNVAGARRVLTEDVEYQAIAEPLANLPTLNRPQPAVNSGARVWPQTSGQSGSDGAMEYGSEGVSGLVVDWNTVLGGTAIAFSTGLTYRVMGAVSFTQSVTFNPAYIKYDRGASITTGGVSGTGAYLTASDDNSLGEAVGTGNPCGTYASYALVIQTNGNQSVSNLEVRYADTAILVYATGGAALNLSLPSLRVLSGNTGISLSPSSSGNVTITANNLYTCGVTTPTSVWTGLSAPGATSCANSGPTLAPISNQMISHNGTTVSLYPFDSETPNKIFVTASSSDTSVVPNDSTHLSVNGCGLYPTLTIVPLPGNTGAQATISVTANDGTSLTTSRSFQVTVNDPPTITGITPRQTTVDAPTALIGFTVHDPDGNDSFISVTAGFDSTMVQSVAVSGTGSSRTVQVTPMPGIVGVTTVTLVAQDSGGALTTSPFDLIINPSLNDPDSYQFAFVNPASPGTCFGGGCGSGGGTGSGSTGNLIGPCPIPDVGQFKQTISLDDSCNVAALVGRDENDAHFIAPLGGSSTCEYHLRVTLEANLRNVTGLVDLAGVTSTIGPGFQIQSDASGAPSTCTMQTITRTGDVWLKGGCDSMFNLFISSFDYQGGNQGVSSAYVTVKDIVVIEVKYFDDDVCASGCVFGAGSAKNGSVDMRLKLGRSAFGKYAAALNLYDWLTCTNLATPSRLYAHAAGSDTDCVMAPGTSQIRQIKVPSGLVDVCTLATNHYQLCFYGTNGIGNSGNKSNGLYVTNSVAPISVYDVCNPNASDCNTLCVNEIRGGLTISNKYVFVPAAGLNPAEWQVYAGSNLRLDRRQYVTNGSSRCETQLVVNPNSGLIVRKHSQQYQTYSFGEVLVQSTLDPDAAQLNSYYTYYTNTTDAGFGKLAQTTSTLGAWQISQYDSQKRLVTVFSGLGNQGPTSDPTLCRMITYDYTPLPGSADTGVYRPQLPRTEVESRLGHEISRKYYVYAAGQKTEIVCTTPGAVWTDANNLKTITRRVTSGLFTGELASLLRQDGTLTTYVYSTNASSKTTTICQGQADGTGTSVVDGTRTVTVVNAVGELISQQFYDIVTGTLLDQKLYSNYDTLQRPQLVTYPDNSSEQMIYGCCGLDHTIDRDGVATYFTYDALKRKVSETKNGISMIYTYDASGNLVATTRQGTNGSQIVLKQSAFDLSGRIIAETNAASVVTTYSYAIDGAGQSVKTTTYAYGTADQSTRIETYAKDGSLLKVTGTAVNPVRFEHGVEQDGGTGPFLVYEKEIKLDASGNDTYEWTKTYTDAAGRAYKTIFAAASGAPATQSYFNPLGQLFKQVDPDGVTRLFAYNLKGDLQDSASDTNRNGIIDTSGLDRITRTLRDIYVNTSGYTVQRTRTLEFPNNNDGSTTVEVSRTEVTAGGSPSWSVSYGLSTRKDVVYNAAGATRTETTKAPDGSSVVNYYLSGRLQSATRYDSVGIQIGQTTFTYDAHGRVASSIDARNGTQTYGYDAMDRVTSATSPPPGNGQRAQTTQTVYDNMGRPVTIINPDGSSVSNQYYTTGSLYQTSGSRTYPVRYTYDAQGRLHTMTTWTSFSNGSGAAVTTWNYDPYRGWLTSKIDATGSGPSYSYSAAGRLTYTTLARTGQFIAIGYDNLGLAASRSYPGSGPVSLNFGYDRRNRMTTVIQGGNTTTLYYNDAGLLLGQAQSGGTLNGYSLTNNYDVYLRKSYVAARTPANSLCGASTYYYDNASRLSTVSFYNGAAVTYGYLANSSLVDHITWQQSGATRLTVNKSYDYLNRLNSISSTPSGAPGLGYRYGYNDANQRVGTTLADGSMWLYEYDSLGQVTSGKRFWSDGTPVAGQQFQYSFNDIGSRVSTFAGGDANGGSLRSSSYSPNSRNEYSSRTVPGAVDVLGIANTGATVTVAGQATYRKGEYFQSALSLNNASSPVYQSVTTTAVNGASNSSVAGNVLIPAANEVYATDLDGNLTSDGLWTYSWDAENRLTMMQSQAAVPASARKQLVFEYDYLGRRIAKSLYTWNGSAYVLQSTTVYVSDGWNLIAEFGPTVRTYSWGSDLSGSMQGAGGVGGLVATTLYTGTTYFPVYDGNGNIGGWVSGSDGTVPAQCEYGPFGEAIRTTSSMPDAIPFRWSTKYTDLETDLVYYGHRYYNPSTGRWLSRDPIEEKGGPNLYAFPGNNPVNLVDFLGLVRSDCGTFTVTHQNPGFDIDFTPARCGCPKDQIRLVQAVKLSAGLLSHGWWFDYLPAQWYAGAPKDSIIYEQTHTKGGLPFIPSNRADIDQGLWRGDYGYFDRPDAGGNDATWNFEVCALCDLDKDNRNLVRGCVTFQLNYNMSTKLWKLTVPNGKSTDGGTTYTAGCADPSDGWNAALKLWNQQAGSRVGKKD